MGNGPWWQTHRRCPYLPLAVGWSFIICFPRVTGCLVLTIRDLRATSKQSVPCRIPSTIPCVCSLCVLGSLEMQSTLKRWWVVGSPCAGKAGLLEGDGINIVNKRRQGWEGCLSVCLSVIEILPLNKSEAGSPCGGDTDLSQYRV